MQQHRAKHLLGGVEEPDLERASGPLAPTLEDEREQRQATQTCLHDEGKGAEEAAFAVFGAWLVGLCGFVGVFEGVEGC